jgi:nitric oxide reductase NorQ protein
MKYYFFKTVKDGSRNRLNPLPFQTASDGTAIIQKLNTQVAAGGMKLREAYPIGTVFCSSMCELSARAGTPYYCAGDIYPILEGNSNYDFNLPTPTREMLDAYDEYKQLAKQEAASNLFAGKSAQTAPKKLSLLDKIRSEKRYAVPQIEKDGFFVREEDWYLLIRNILTKTATMMTGPSGTGKTELVALAGKKLGLEVCIYNMGTMLDPISGLLGVHRLVQGGSVFDYAKFTEDIQKPCVILLDELSRAPLSANNILLPCLDSRRELPVDIAGGNGMRNIKVHPDCVFIATANIGAEYTGTTQMDRALVDRFFMQEIEYMDEDSEAKVLAKRCGIETSEAKIIVETARTLRSLFSKGDISSTVSTRETLGAGRMVADGWTVLEAMERCFLPFYEGTKTEGERSVVYKTFLKH